MSRIMIVDDDWDILKYCESVLAPLGHEVVQCSTPDEAILVLQKHNVDLMIVDIIMPTASGFDLLRTLKRNINLVVPPVLMLTRKRSAEDVKKAVELGALDYIIKPIEKDMFVNKVQSILGKIAPRVGVSFATGSSNSQAEIVFPSTVTTVNEMGMVILATVPVERNTRLTLNTPVFQEIGIPTPLLRVGNCVESGTKDDRYRYEIFLSFIGLDDPAMQKIRRWISARAIAMNNAKKDKD